jgi:hypothetical protein
VVFVNGFPKQMQNQSVFSLIGMMICVLIICWALMSLVILGCQFPTMRQHVGKSFSGTAAGSWLAKS